MKPSAVWDIKRIPVERESRMKKRIYRNMCLVTLVAILFSAILTSFLYYQNLEKQMRQELVTEAKYLEAGMDLSGEHYLTNITKIMNSSNRNRITWVAADGTVLFDNMADASTMENHKDRPEIQMALSSGSGRESRMSSTLSEQTFYYALRLEDGSVIRVANTTRSALAGSMAMLPALGGAAVLIMVLSMILAERQTREIVKPINELDLDHPDSGRLYDELAPLVGKVERQQRTIRQQMDTLKTKQREFTAITENMSEGFLVVGKQGEVASYNTSALKILDVEIPVPEERTPGSLNILNFNRSHEFRTAVDEALAGHHHEENLKIGTRMYQIIANPVTEKQNVTGAVIVILDITEREEREDLRREFSANVSHELKTPLTSISGYAEIMKNGLVKPEDMKRFSENIYQEAQRMITLICDIIKLSQLDENRVELEKQAVDLYPIAQSVVSRLKERASQAKVALEIRGEGQIIEGTSKILDEMIYNLCDNGIKYNKAGGHVNVTVGSRQRCPFVSVADNGIGIPEEDQKRVFERFYRVDKSHSRQIGGTGLGLSIVKHGAIYHNAKVEMESTPGRGTSITIVFPEGAAK